MRPATARCESNTFHPHPHPLCLPHTYAAPLPKPIPVRPTLSLSLCVSCHSIASEGVGPPSQAPSPNARHFCQLPNHFNGSGLVHTVEQGLVVLSHGPSALGSLALTPSLPNPCMHDQVKLHD